jgi:hypothetical protein
MIERTMENWTPLDDALPVGELDPAIVELCHAINEFPGLRTRESCQGFVDGHRPGKPWAVYFQPTPSPPTRDGYTSLEFITWLCCYTARDRGFDVSVELNAPPPYLNGPGELRSSSARCGVGSFVCRLEITMHNNHQTMKRSWADGRRLSKKEGGYQWMYDSPQWQARRRQQLRHHPLCAACL